MCGVAGTKAGEVGYEMGLVGGEGKGCVSESGVCEESKSRR